MTHTCIKCPEIDKVNGINPILSFPIFSWVKLIRFGFVATINGIWEAYRKDVHISSNLIVPFRFIKYIRTICMGNILSIITHIWVVPKNKKVIERHFFVILINEHVYANYNS